MNRFTKCFILACGIYALAQVPGHVVFASSNVDSLSAETTVSQETNTGTKVDSGSESNIITKSNIAVTKIWNVKFNEPVDINTLNGKIKLVNNLNNNTIPINLTIDNTQQTVTVTPTASLSPQTDYTLSVSKDIVSKFGKQLSKPTVLNFKTSAVILSIADISKNINQWDNYTLPTSVTANMSDGTTSSVPVKWDKPLENTNTPGTYTFKGTISEYGAINMTLTINKTQLSGNFSNSKRTQSATGKKLYTYLMNSKNRNDVLNRAISIHAAQLPGDNPYSNNCAFYQSEALRSIGVGVPQLTANTRTLTNVLLSLGWVKSTDLSLMLPGDICFTIAYDSSGPTHTYTFMGWVDPKSFNYAYVCDNQGNEFSNDAYHQRNIAASGPKDKISYFMYLPA